MAQLIENFVMENARIVEADKKKLPPGVLLQVEGLGQKCGVKNANGRIYPKEVWEHVFARDGDHGKRTGGHEPLFCRGDSCQR